MVIKINRKGLVHYILIYFLILINQSSLYEYFLRGNKIRIGILVLFSFLILIKYKKTYNKYIGILVILLLCTSVTRALSGGIGIMAWVEYAIPIITCVYIINFDIENFFERFVKLTVFLATIGLIFFIFQIVNSELLKSLLLFRYNTLIDYRIWSDGFNYQSYYYEGYGLFLYTYRNGGDALMRNKGLFTESGICQMLYNSAIIILLYFPNKVNLSRKQIKQYLAVLIVAIITVQSTTGYMILGSLLISYLFVKNKNNKELKKYIFTLFLIGIVSLIADLSIRGTDSFLNIAIINKIFGSNNQFEIQGSGMSRIGAAMLSISAMLKNPLGIGADNLFALQEVDTTAGGGAGIMKFGAMAGVIPFILCILFYTIPILKAKLNSIVKLLLLFFIFYTLFAQSNPFYPILIIFPIYLMERRVSVERNSVCHISNSSCIDEYIKTF